MKEITVENFNYSNVKDWIKDYSHADKVRFAVHCAENNSGNPPSLC